MDGSVLRWIGALGGTVVAVPFVSMLLVGVVVVGIQPPVGRAGQGAPVAVGRLAVPSSWARAEVLAAQTCPGLSWSVLGALGWLTSGTGRSRTGTPPPWWPTDGGVFGVVPGDGRRGDTPLVAATRAARRVCAAQITSGSLAAGLAGLLASASFALEVLVLSVSLRDAPRLVARDAMAIDFAVRALGVPYVWGGNGPDGYDCSGLMVAAEHAAGRSIPRTAQAQHDVARLVDPPGLPGDLAFFGSGPADVGHVGLIIGSGLMIDAPHTGAVVRIESYAWDELVDEGGLVDQLT